MTSEATAPRQLSGPGVWSVPFALLCFTVLLGYSHNALLTPTVPLYVQDHGGSAALAGLVLLAFSIPSFSVRPLLGHLSDVWSAPGVLALGGLFLALGALLYLSPLLALFIVGGAIRGLGWAGLNTGGYTLLAEAAPLSRRGEAAGYYTSITTSAMILFPALALWLIDIDGLGFTSVFLLSTALALLSVPLAGGVLRPMVRRAPAVAEKQAASGASVAGSGFIDRGVIVATALNLSSTMIAPAVSAFLPLYARDLGIDNIGFFYIISGITSLLIRPILGRKSDSIGRGPSIAGAFVCQLIGLGLIVAAQNLPMILLGGVFTALGSAVNGSATTALAMDLADPARRGKAMATFSISFQVGAGLGAVLAGALADLVGFRGMYLGAMTMSVCGLLLLSASWKSLSGARPTAA